MLFIDEKDSDGVIPHLLTAILDECINGVILSDPDLPDTPIVYANKAFETLTGYSQEETIGFNCRFLQADDQNQEASKQISEAMKKQESIEVTIRNYKKDGTLFYNRLKITPLLDKKGRIIYYLGVQYDMTEQVEANNEIRELNAIIAMLSK
ncbi:MAG: PAS domain-containing protein [Methylococcales bacterium]|nr:PAS domain-containing protein [Methylococcales bacterium]